LLKSPQRRRAASKRRLPQMIKQSLDEVHKMMNPGENTGFYEDGSDNENHIGDEIDSISGDIDDTMSAEGQIEQVQTAVAKVQFQSTPQSKTAPIASSNAALSDAQFQLLRAQMEQMQKSQTMFASFVGGKTAKLALTNPGIQRKTIKAVWEGSLGALQNGTREPRFQPELLDMQKALGEGANITKVSILGYDFSGSPITSGVKAPAHMTHASHNHLTVNGEVLFEGARMTKETFDEPVVTYVGNEYNIGNSILKRFPSVTVQNVGAGVKDSVTKGKVWVPVGDVVEAALIDEIETMKAEAASAGKPYTGVTIAGLLHPELQALHVEKALATRAMNTLITTLAASNKMFDANKDLYFEFARTVLSKDSIDKMGSSTATTWTDRRELTTFLKNGSTIDNMVASVFSASLTVEIEYTSPKN
jgi:hypothetical protein